MVSVTVQIAEAKRLLSEKTSLNLKASILVKQNGVGFCTPECKELCFATSCYCVCPNLQSLTTSEASVHHEAPLSIKQNELSFCTPKCKELCFGTGCYCVCPNASN